MNNRTYGIVDATYANLLNYSEILQTSETTLRKSLDGTQAVVKWIGGTPSGISGSCSCIEVDGRTAHNHSEILTIMAATVSVGDWKAWSATQSEI